MLEKSKQRSNDNFRTEGEKLLIISWSPVRGTCDYLVSYGKMSLTLSAYTCKRWKTLQKLICIKKKKNISGIKHNFILYFRKNGAVREEGYAQEIIRNKTF